MGEEWRTYGKFVRWKDCREVYGPIKTRRFWIALIFFSALTIANACFVPKEYFSDALTINILCWFFLLVGFCAEVRTYIRRNVVGYNLWIYYDEEPHQNITRDLSGQVFPRSRLPDNGNLMIVPIGGWFNRPRIVYERRGGYGSFAGSDKPYWRLTGFTWRDHQELPGSQVIVRTRHGEVMTMNTSEFIHLLEYLWRYKGHAWYPPAMPIGMALNDLLCARTQLRDNKITLLKIVEDTIDAIADSKRFSKSKEGARIREQLISDMVAFLPENHSLRKKLVASNRPAA